MVAALAAFAPRFAVDVSAESLVQSEDDALRYYRSVRARYGSDDFLIVTYAPRSGDLYARATLERIRTLRDRLSGLEGVKEVTSLLDVPLLESPPVGLGELAGGGHRLLSPETDIALARREFATSPLYRNLLVGADGTTTGMQVALVDGLQPREVSALVARVRGVLAGYRADARVHLAGVPMIVSDMVGFVKHDLRVFGLAAAAFIVLLLAAAFRRPRWVLVPSFACAAAALAMAGLLGLLGWKVTVVSSNFMAVLLIATLSLCVHLIVRCQELREADAGAGQRELVERTLRGKLMPSFYTALTTAVAFGSLTVSGIVPVVDFGWIMVIGVGVAFAIVAVAFPAALVRLPPADSRGGGELARRFAAACARWVGGHRAATLAIYAALLAASAAGIARLTVDNRFVDYFKDDTAIHQGMVEIDRKLGGSTPLEVLVEAPGRAAPPAGSPRAGAEPDRAGLVGRSYWLGMFRHDQVKRIHDFLEGVHGVGKVLSIATTIRMLEQAAGGPLDDFTLTLAYRRMPEELRRTLFDPYISADGGELRFAARVYETREALDRDALLAQIRGGLAGPGVGLEPAQVRLTGMVVLYNNVLHTLFASQAKTLGFVFAAILAMFALLFRSLRVAAVAIVPNVVAAAIVLGTIGALGIPLDIMTITIAAIALGIGVDDTIHYTHRFLEESAGADRREAIARTHAGVGRALVYTSLTIAAGLSVFAASSFVPTIHFGLLAGFAMLAALLANLTLLPALLETFHAGRRAG